MICPVCGLPMVHSRLRGYHCHFERHNEQAREMERDTITAIREHVLTVLTDEEIDNVLDGNPPVEFTERFQQRALKAMREAQKNRAVKFN